MKPTSIHKTERVVRKVEFAIDPVTLAQRPNHLAFLVDGIEVHDEKYGHAESRQYALLGYSSRKDGSPAKGKAAKHFVRVELNSFVPGGWDLFHRFTEEARDLAFKLVQEAGEAFDAIDWSKE